MSRWTPPRRRDPVWEKTKRRAELEAREMCPDADRVEAIQHGHDDVYIEVERDGKTRMYRWFE